jgi:hypothetical protein
MTDSVSAIDTDIKYSSWLKSWLDYNGFNPYLYIIYIQDMSAHSFFFANVRWI